MPDRSARVARSRRARLAGPHGLQQRRPETLGLDPGDPIRRDHAVDEVADHRVELPAPEAHRHHRPPTGLAPERAVGAGEPGRTAERVRYPVRYGARPAGPRRLIRPLRRA